VRVVDELPRPVRCLENVWIPLSDGARLASRVWLPEDAEDDPVPAILEYIPYRKRDFTRRRDSVNHPYLAGHGYACVRVDLRGSGDSDGVLRDQYLEQEQADGVEAIQWLAKQPWCTGAVGMLGISWGGFNALQIAARQPPELKALVAACATDDLYVDNMHYMGGCLLADNLSEATVMFAFNGCPPDPEIVGPRWREMWLERLRESGLWLDIWLRHPRRDAFWKRGSVCEDYSAIRCPVMAVSGWADGYTNAVFRLLEHLEVPRLGLVGPWGHRYPHLGIPGPTIGFLQEVRRWFDQWLKGEDTGIRDEPMLRAWMQDSVPPTTRYDERPGRWVAEPRWPSPNVEERRVPLAPGRILWSAGAADPDAARAAQEPPLTIQSPLTVGLFAGKWCSYAAVPDLPDDQRQEDGGALVFESAPLGEALEILGGPTAELELTASRPVAQVAARLSDVHPDGKATRVTYGVLNLTHRDSHEEPSPLEPGKRYRVRVRLNRTAQCFPKGHRLRLSLSTSYWPIAWPPPEPVRLEVFPGASALVLPVREPRPDEDDRLRSFGPAEGSPMQMGRQLVPERHGWVVIRDLAEDLSVLEVTNDHGTWLIEDTGTEIRQGTWEWYRSRADELGSVEGETRTERRFRRGDWDARTVTRTLLRSSATHFFLTAEIDAWEGDKRIFSHNWDETIPRDLL